TLRLNTDLGSVRILQLERGATPTVRYSVHIETDAREPLASQLLERYMLNAKGTASGIEITGNLPQQVSRAANSAQFWVHFEVTVPASYGLDINTGAGDILTPDVGGAATLVTEGGNIVAVKTGGGQTDFGEVRGSVHAQTGGGGIRVMYVSGPMDVESSGGSICLTRVSGAVRAETGSGTITAWINPEAGGNANTSV